MTRFGLSLLRLSPRAWIEASIEAERLGFESVWMSEHLVLPAEFERANYPSGRLPIDPMTPVFDVMVYLSAISALTTRLRLGTFVFELGLRHPFIAARAISTLDVVSGGRVELGVGAGWLREEWTAAGTPFERRGARLEEAITVCRRLWQEPVVEHHGEFFDFPPVAFEPKPPQGPALPVHVGGETPAALGRAVRVGTGWIGMEHTPESAAAMAVRLRALERDAGRLKPLEVSVAARPGPDVDVAAWRDSEVDRVLVAPWTSSRTAVEELRAFARQHGIGGGHS